MPENVVGEIVDGELHTSPRPAVPHAVGASALGATLVTRMQFGDGGPGGWWILDEPELPGRAHRRSRHRRLATREHGCAATRRLHHRYPDWVCEILSPATGRFDRTRKLPLYTRLGVPHLWLLDPTLETLETYRLEAGHWVLLATHAGDDLVRTEPFDAIEVDLKRIWGR